MLHAAFILFLVWAGVSLIVAIVCGILLFIVMRTIYRLINRIFD